MDNDNEELIDISFREGPDYSTELKDEVEAEVQAALAKKQKQGS